MNMLYKARELGTGSADDPESWTEIEAFDAATAAEDFVQGIQPYAEGQDEFEVEVMNTVTGGVTRWDVKVEYEPTFCATRMKKSVLELEGEDE